MPFTVTNAPARATAPIWVLGNLQSNGHQGHNLLAYKLGQRGAKLAGWRDTRYQRILANVLRRLPAYRKLNPRTTYNLYRANSLTRQSPGHVGLLHIIWGDYLIDRLAHPERCVVTLHQPFETWSDAVWAQIGRCAGILCMAQREADEIQRRHPAVPAEFIAHGIDIDFWKPLPTPPKKQICAVGRYMRNIDMMLRVARVLLREHADLSFRWLANPDFKLSPEMSQALPQERFEVLRNLSPVELHRLYAESWLFCMPYDNVTASNAIVESMASGTPVVTTRVGGMPSYSGRDAITMVGNNDDVAMIAAVNRSLESLSQRNAQADRAREYAVNNFNWPVVSAAHEAFYARVLQACARA
ncbi:MAG TPA: glycosyltransferase [Opitutaceae bacterium]|nr:glycosyltransferase [Opitutaceae bacterium]